MPTDNLSYGEGIATGSYEWGCREGQLIYRAPDKLFSCPSSREGFVEKVV